VTVPPSSDAAVGEAPGVAGAAGADRSIAELKPSVEQDDQPGEAAGPMRRLIITIDGPAGAGKSSVARDLAGRLGLEFLDTGAMYRAATALAIDHTVSLKDEKALARLLRDADLHFDWTTDPPTLLAFGEPIMDRLRDKDVAAGVSPVSQLPLVRKVLVELQRRIGERHPRLVSEGRDQGSVVFFDAEAKFYLDATTGERARRRVEQIRATGRDADLGEIERAIVERDERDATRDVSPLVCPEDAIRLDSSDIDRGQVVDELERRVRSTVPADVIENRPGGATGA
jgi:cytidylate kinase